MCAVLGSPCTAKTDQPERAQSRTIKMASRLQHVMNCDTKNKLVQPTEKTKRHLIFIFTTSEERGYREQSAKLLRGTQQRGVREANITNGNKGNFSSATCFSA